MARKRKEKGKGKERGRQPLSGTPAGKGGLGRKEEVKGSGVYPASLGAENIPDDAELRGQAEWGQGERGAEGYYDTGPSELRFTLEEAEQYQRQLAAEKEKKEKGKEKGKKGKK